MTTLRQNYGLTFGTLINIRIRAEPYGEWTNNLASSRIRVKPAQMEKPTQQWDHLNESEQQKVIHI